ncbi:MAG TPA: lactonase family protein [Chloroflexota bacterium]|jgi:6-phosphogluconolactonase (cycloisomerase 2 family)|nr:lactonase family protein [Chloroflexota bacterium]
MQSRDAQRQESPVGGVSRRVVLAGAAALAAAGSVATLARAEDEQGRRRRGEILAYVGTYSAHGAGIYLFHVNPTTGALRQIKVFPSTTNPSWLAFDPRRKFLYAGNEIDNFNGTTAGSVSAFAVDRSNGDLTLLNTVSSQGAGPAHVSVDPSGKWVLVANYGGGNVAVLPVRPDGSLGNATDVKNDADACPGSCPVGPIHAEKAPPGSFAISGHDAPHAHMIQTDPAGNFVIVADLGLDLTQVWKFDRVNGKLTDPKTVKSSPGAGPRHFAFHPNGRFFYSLNEEASTLAFMTYDARTGSLSPVQEISTLPPAFVGTNFTSEVMVSADGRFVYAANRLHDTIAVFAVGPTGAPTLLGEQWTRGDYPRSFNIEPTGRFMYVCNHRGDSITTLSVEGGGRELRFTDQYTPVGSPAVIVFLEV